MSADDPSFWQQISGYLWGLLAVPIKMLWSKADNAATKQELADAIKAASEGTREWRDVTRQLFANAEHDRAEFRSMVQSVENKIHDTHIDILNRLK